MIIDKIFIKRLLSYFILFPLLPFWWVQKLIPRSKNIWIFGAWHGQTYSDNSRSLFEYVTNYHKEVKAVWLTKSNDIVSFIESKGQQAFLTHSFKGIYYSLRAKIIVISNGKSDVNRFFINGATVLQLWHGSPMKKIGLDESIKSTQRKLSNREIDSPLFWKTIPKYVYPFFYEYNVHYLVSQADYFCEFLQTAFEIKSKQVIVTGYPRNDRFFSTHLDHASENRNKIIDKSKFCIMYLPTFRSRGSFKYLMNNSGFSQERIGRLLENINGKLYLKAHFANLIESKFSSDRIETIKNDPMLEINALLKDINVLITDYSGCYFDFLLLNRPVIFAPFDHESYVKYDRELYDDYDSYLAGYKASNWMDIENEIMRIYEGKDNYSDHRLTLNQKFNAYQDAHSSKRIVDFVLKK